MIKKEVKAVKKYLDFQVKSIAKAAGSDDCIVEGYANTSSKDRVGDVVLPKAFEKSLPTYLKNPVLLANHDWNDPCGKVIHAEITEKGLYIKARISNTREDIKTLIREGCLSTFSIGYNEVDTDYNEETKTKYIKELELLEISVVTVPANIEASFTVADTKQEEPKEEKPAEQPKEEAQPEKSVQPRTAKQLAEFIQVVKDAVETDLNEKQVFAVCEYFNQEGEIMTKEELIKALRAKSVDGAAPAPTSTPAAAPEQKEEEQKPAEEAKPEDKLSEVLAKIDAIAEAMAQVLEHLAQPKGEEQPSEEKPEEEKGEEEAQEEKPEEEMSEEELDEKLAALESEIASVEDQENT